MSYEKIHTEQAPEAIGPYSQAIRCNGFLFCSGQIALDPASGHVVAGGVEEQAEQAMRNLSAVLKAGGTSWDRVVKTTIFLASMDDFATVNAIYGAHLGTARPARATVAAAGLPKGVLVEVDAVAACD